jgi:purine-binding chemotaxis protein CheW
MKKKTRIRYGELTPNRPIAAVPAPAAERRPTPAIPVVAIPDAPPVLPAPPIPEAALSQPGPRRRAGVAKAPARTLRERASARVGHAEVLVFRVGNEHFAVELGAVEEAIDIPPIHHVPEMPDAMLGVITVRGSLTSLYSPRRVLGSPQADGQSALVFRRARARVALSIDDVDDVLTLDLTTLRDAPDATSDRALILGVARHGVGLIALLDAETLLGACAAAPLQETA